MGKKLTHADAASQEMLKQAEEQNLETVWDRYEAMQPQCKLGKTGICCRICNMGPCRVTSGGKKPTVGVCGADADTVVARNLTRMIAAGSAAHSDHGRTMALTLLQISQNSSSDYEIKDPEKLKKLAELYIVDTADKDTKTLAGDLARAILNDFGKYEGHVNTARMAPPARQKLWKELGILPRAIDREIVEIMHRTHVGVDADYKNIIKQGLRVAVADGWGGSMIATLISDILFGTPHPLRSSANLGVLKEDHVNLVVHGHEPTLSDIIAVMSQEPTLIQKAKDAGAAGINIAGICCTANEILMRHGIPMAGSFLQQELAMMTGVVDSMVVDVQCVMPGLNRISDCFHTQLITTSPKAKMPGFTHVEFHEDQAKKTAVKIIELGIDNFKNRDKSKVFIPKEKEDLVAGFSSESIYEILGGKFRATYRPLNEGIISGRIRGAAGVIGCSNPNTQYERGHLEIIKELIKNDTLVVTTGCSAVSCAKHGLLKPEAAFQYAGKGLQEICKAVGIPPVLHVGSCVDNSRILTILSNIVSEGGLGDDISRLPIAGAAPEWMSEKAVAIGFYFVASGVYTMASHPLPVTGGEGLYKYITGDIEKETGGKWDFEMDPIELSHKMLSHIDRKRNELKLKPMIYEQAFRSE